jgi:hypothetical protein
MEENKEVESDAPLLSANEAMVNECNHEQLVECLL